MVENADEHPAAALARVKEKRSYAARVSSCEYIDEDNDEPLAPRDNTEDPSLNPSSPECSELELDSPTSPKSVSSRFKPPSAKCNLAKLRQKSAFQLAAALSKRDLASWQINAEHEVGTDAAHHHAKHGKAPSILSALVSGFINYLLMFGLCCAYGMIMFSDEHNLPHRALGVKINLATAFITGLLLALKSKVGVAIGGPDLNPVVFLGGFVTVMSESIAKQVGLGDDYPGGGRRLQEYSTGLMRHLGGGGGASDVDFCTPGGYHESKYHAECMDYHEQLRATAIFATAVSSGVLGLLYFLLGHFKVTRLVSYVPTSVQEAFLSCIGYKVFKYALKFCNFQPLQFIPAACVGVPLYFLKAMHIGNPAIVIPGMVLAPLVIFYMVVLFAQLDIETMRISGASDNWMFPRLDHVNFWDLWTNFYGKADKINFSAWAETLPDFVIMIVVCVIDCLLKISSTESKLPVKVDKNYEAKLYGLGNILTTVSGSSVGYMQLKFNVINYGVIGNTTDRRAGVIYALLCGACFFGTIGHFNYLPRFFLGVLLFFAGTGFVAENLWGSRQYLSLPEWGEILLILAVFIFSGSLVAAVIVGVLVTCVSLIMKYTKVSCISGKPIPGGSIQSCERRSYLLLGQLSHIADSWFYVIRLKGFIFFASAQHLTTRVRQLVKQRESLDTYRKLKYIVFDCEMLDGMDASAGKSIRKLLIDLEQENIKILWSSISDEFANDLLKKEMLDSHKHAFHNMDLAVLYIEEIILRYQVMVQKRLLKAHPMFELQHNLQQLSDDQEPWGSVLLNFTTRHGCPWRYCSKVSLKEFRTLLWKPGSEKTGLFLIHTGKVALFDEIPKDEQGEWKTPVAVYGHGWFLNREALLKKPTKHFAVATMDGEILVWTAESWWLMAKERPAMAEEIWRAVMSQQSTDTGAQDWLTQQMIDGDFDIVEEDEEADEDEDEDEDDDQIARTVSFIESTKFAKAHLPEQLKVLISSLEVAERFATMGFYSGIDPFELSKLPKLPTSIEEDLQVAFDTYALQKNDEWLISWDEVSNALMYAGIPRVPLVDTDIAFLKEEEFVALGHAAAMARFPVSVVAMLQEIFRNFCKKQDWPSVLDVHQVAFLLRKSIHRSFSQEIVYGVLKEMNPDAVANEDAFVSIVSRLVQWHRPYWHLLSNIKECLAEYDDPDHASTMLKSEVLAKKLNIKQDRASEILWASDWRRGERGQHSWGKMLHLYDLALAVLTCVEQPVGSLPPPPVFRETPTTGGCLRKAGADTQGGPCIELEFETKPFKREMSPLSLNLQGLIADLHSAPEQSSLAKALNNRTLANVEHLECQRTASQRDSSGQRVSLSMQPEAVSEEEEKEEKPPTLRARLHILLEEPTSSLAANVLSMGMAILIMISIATMFVQPVVEHGREDEVSEVEADLWFYLELVLTIAFTVEYVLRLSVANALGTQTTFGFVTSPANMCDLAAIMPFYIEAAFNSAAQEFRLLRIVRLLRLTRIARIGRLAKRSPIFPPVAMVLIVIWGIHMKNGLSADSK